MEYGHTPKEMNWLRKGEKPKLLAKGAKVNRSSIYKEKHKQKVSR